MKNRILAYSSLCIWFIVAIFDIRFIEALFSTFYVGDFFTHVKNNLLGFCFDTTYTIPGALLVLPLYLLSSKIFPKATNTIFRILLCISLYIGLTLVSFYAKAQFPLDRILFLYSLSEIKETIINSGLAPWWMYLIYILYPIVFFYATKIQIELKKFVLIPVISIIALCGTIRITCYDNSIENLSYPEQCNKACYFVSSIIEGNTLNNFDKETIYKNAKTFHSYFPERIFKSQKCPFLHEKDTTSNLLPFFDLQEKKPNIVLIIVEGLAKENSGKYSTYTTATPFLDSLSEHALTWNNCLSVSQRTAGVLPGTLGALPFGRGGFMAYKKDAPDFYSLPKFLKENGYDFSFYYGGWCGFDDMSHFIDLQDGKQCFEKNYDTTSQRNNWGLLDKFLFKEAINNIDFSSEKPRFEVYMTLTSHDPWEYPQKEQYVSQYIEKTNEQKAKQNPDKIAAASYLYVDESIQQLIQDYSTHEGFENTIFIITGDHNFNTNTFILERYHVPLIIWSPMLNRVKEIPAVVSHRDIPASITTMLSKQYNMKQPESVSWINSQLDTSSTFRSTTFAPQIDVSRNVVSMIYNQYYVYENTCYNIRYNKNRLQLHKVKEKALNDSIKKLLNTYKYLDLYVCSCNALIDSTNIYTSRKELVHKDFRNFRDYFPQGKLDTANIQDEYFNLLSFKLKSGHKLLRPFFTCQYTLANDTIVQDPMLVIKVTDTSSTQIFWEAYPIKMEYGTWQTFDFSNAMISLQQYNKKGNVLNLFIWNPKQIPFKITDLHVGIFEVE
ncbi:MAG: LTA synthase family protein [Bacteroidales bacterium]|nr:LTA synthase family protein [Bacteroidales bacterium]